MRILVEHGEHQHRNRGDVAMLQVTTQRLRELWPLAELWILTGDPERLDALVPGVVPVQIRHGRAARLGSRLGLRQGPDPLDGVDLLVCAGGGYLTDVDPAQADRVLRLMIRAQEREIPTVMFGQGIGPLRSPELRALAARALPGALMIALREQVAGPRLLGELGVPPARVVVTGDDAIRLAREGAPAALGEGLAVNHRIAEYMAADDGVTEIIRASVHSAAFRRGAALIPIPVSEWDDDRPGTARITDGYPLVEQPEGMGAPPAGAITRLDHARVVVTSTYHLAVFALSRGVPAVCPASSDYYRDKFRGLRDLFGAGCRMVDLASPHPGEAMVTAIDELWEAAADLRPGLLAAADRQVALGDSAYATARELVESVSTRAASTA